jgi:hypothetical protein
MPRRTPKTIRRHFFVAAGHALSLTWPVLSIILAFQVVLGQLIGFLEGWPVGDAVYFTFVTGLTIGYGDIVPRQALSRALAVAIGISGLFLTGVVAGIAVYAMHAAIATPADVELRAHNPAVIGLDRIHMGRPEVVVSTGRVPTFNRAAACWNMEG